MAAISTIYEFMLPAPISLGPTRLSPFHTHLLNSLFHGRPCIFSARHTQRNWQLSPPPFHHTHLRLCVHYPRPRLSPYTFSLSFSTIHSHAPLNSLTPQTLCLSHSELLLLLLCSTYCLCCSCCALPRFCVSRCRPTSTALSAKSLPPEKRTTPPSPLLLLWVFFFTSSLWAFSVFFFFFFFFTLSLSLCPHLHPSYCLFSPLFDFLPFFSPSL